MRIGLFVKKNFFRIGKRREALLNVLVFLMPVAFFVLSGLYASTLISISFVVCLSWIGIRGIVLYRGTSYDVAKWFSVACLILGGISVLGLLWEVVPAYWSKYFGWRDLGYGFRKVVREVLWWFGVR